MRIISLLLLILSLASPVYAFSFQEGGNEHIARTLLDNIDDFVDIPEGGIDWKLLGTTKENFIETTTEDGYDLMYSKPEFPPAVKALDCLLYTSPSPRD